MSGDYDQRTLLALLDAARSDADFSGWLASVLARVAGQLGSSYALVAGRPGSWESAALEQLLPPDEYLPGPIGGRKLTDAKAQEILDRWDGGYGEVTQAELAEEYGVSVSAISRLARGVTWAWLKRPTWYI